MTRGSLSLARIADHPALTPARLGALLALLMLLIGALGLAAGSEGWSWAWGDDWALIEAIRAPRTLGALAAGALLGLAGALAQGLFRNPLADPFLLGSAAGAGLGVVLVLAAGGALAAHLAWQPLGWLTQGGVVLAAFIGALGGVALTLLLAGGAARPLKLLLCGVVVGVLMGAVSDLLLMVSPEALRGKQMFLLGTTGFLGWTALGWLAGALALALPLAVRFARVLDALVLGDASAASLGLALPRLRLLLVGLMALATGTAVSQAGLVGFVGLVVPHLVRRLVTVTHGPLLALSAAAGAVLLGAADVIARSVIAPQELPVGVLTAIFGGLFLLVLLRRQGRNA
ncbi:MAG TPA: iron chelate uptake ABC transporter family permease subunit [Aquabacterium sp.]|nr:iron chelate uptake ABC transporter family permease subunit [Aquabacterium sp.]